MLSQQGSEVMGPTSRRGDSTVLPLRNYVHIRGLSPFLLPAFSLPSRLPSHRSNGEASERPAGDWGAEELAALSL